MNIAVQELEIATTPFILRVSAYSVHEEQAPKCAGNTRSSSIF